MQNKRLNISVHAVLTFSFQFVLVGMAFHELKTNDMWYPAYHTLSGTLIIFARWICASILHLSLIDEVTIGLDMMKYSVNHSYMFIAYEMAWLSGFLQTISVLLIEIASIGVICASNDVINMVFNFIALSIIAEFDDFVFYSLKNESFKLFCTYEFYEKVIVINHTTSKKCDESELSTVKDELGNLRPLRVSLRSRSCAQRALFIIYKILRMIYVSFFYYFLPFGAIFFSCLLPILYRKVKNDEFEEPSYDELFY